MSQSPSDLGLQHSDDGLRRAQARGLALCVAIAVAAHVIASGIGGSPVVVALLLGLAVGHATPQTRRDGIAPGLDLARKLVLRVGVVLFALRIDLSTLAHSGLQIVVVDALVLGSTYVLATKLGPRLGLTGSQSALIGAGSAVCGVSAILATAAVVKARGEDVAVAVATVSMFGLVAFVLHPLLWKLNGELHVVAGGAPGYGVYIGATVHDIAQVVATASAVAPLSVETALLAKMGRVALLAPFLILLARHARIADVGDATPRMTVADWWTAMALPAACACAAIVGSVGTPEGFAWAPFAAGLCLSTAVAGLGFGIRPVMLRSAGRPAALLGAALLLWLLVSAACIQALVRL